MIKRGISTFNECVVSPLAGTHKGIYLMTLNRPQKKNALGKQMIDEFRAQLDKLRHDPSVRVLVLNSSVPNVFCAGADLKERAEMQPLQVSEFVHKLRSSFTELEEMPMPTISAIDGFALGGGCELALSTDLRIAGETAKFGFPETNLAIIPGAGGTQRLPRIVGMSTAKELIFTGQVLGHHRAQELGLAKAVDGPSLPAALKLAEQMLDKGPIALQMAKLAISKGSQLDVANGMAFEKACYAQVIPTKDRLEGLKAFKEKRKPIYTGE